MGPEHHERGDEAGQSRAPAGVAPTGEHPGYAQRLGPPERPRVRVVRVPGGSDHERRHRLLFWVPRRRAAQPKRDGRGDETHRGRGLGTRHGRCRGWLWPID
jgi:hypothetical protein